LRVDVHSLTLELKKKTEVGGPVVRIGEYVQSNDEDEQEKVVKEEKSEEKKEDHTVADQEENINEEKGELLVVRRDLISFQTDEEEPKYDTPRSKDDNVTILTSLPPHQIPQKNPQKSPRQSSLLLTNQKNLL